MQSSIPLVKLERLKEFRCGDCDKIYWTEARLADHGKWHDLQQYLGQEGVLDHFESAYIKLDRVHIFQCGFCPQAFVDLRKFQNHQANGHKKQKTKQSTQNKTANIDDDSNNNELEKPYKCVECGWRFVAESTLLAHGALHGTMHTCACGVGFYKERDLIAHRRLVHPTKLTWKQETKYEGRKVLPEFAIKPEPDSESDSDSAPTKSIKPRLKAKLVVKKTKKVKAEKKRITKNKENLSGPPYQCSECNRFFKNINIYRSHRIVHTDKASKCPECGKLFANKWYLKIHMVVHTGERPYPCKICNKRFTQSAALYTHLKTVHSNLKEFKCEKCGKGFNIKEQLKRHEVIHTDLKPYVCKFKFCEKGFADQSALGRHIRTHTGECRYFCPHCPAAYTDKSAYNRHVDRNHLNKRYICKICGKALTLLNHLNTHMRIQHGIGEQKLFECDYCGKRFHTKPYLVTHIENNHRPKERKWKCDFCMKMFLTHSSLYSHLRIIHWKKSIFECDYCNMIFVYKTTLINHIKKNHIGTPKKYQCDYCYRRLPEKKSILKHIVFQHLHIKCYSCKQMFYTPVELRKHKCVRCSQCDGLFGTRRKLTAHMKRKHSEKK